MIFWATMLSFIVSVLLAIIYPRNDKPMVEDVPIAEAYVASFATQHQSAINYANTISLVLPYISTSIGDDVAMKKSDSSASIATERLIHVFKDDFNELFLPTIAPTEGHMAPSYNLFPVGNDGYTSALVCLDKVDDKEETDSEGNAIWGTTSTYGNIISCKTTNENTFKYVLTYGFLFPEQEETRIIYKDKRLLWERALTKRTKNTFDCGFIETGSMTTDGKPHIMSLDAQGRRIPDNIFSFYYDPYIKKYNSENGILFCITPINTPYMTNGLMYHFDAQVNEISSGSTISHRELMTGWTNIVSTLDVGIVGDTTAKWHPSDGIPLGLRGGHSLTLDTWDSLNDKSALGGSFTLSFVINFVKPEGETLIEEMPVFGSTQNNVYPRVQGTYKNGEFKVTLMKDEWFRLGRISTRIPMGETSSITYVVTPSSHQLYLNGTLIESQTYPNNLWFTSLNTQSLSIGTDALFSTTQLSADIYNVKVYNRAITEREIQHNLKTDRQRFNF